MQVFRSSWSWSCHLATGLKLFQKEKLNSTESRGLWGGSKQLTAEKKLLCWFTRRRPWSLGKGPVFEGGERNQTTGVQQSEREASGWGKPEDGSSQKLLCCKEGVGRGGSWRRVRGGSKNQVTGHRDSGTDQVGRDEAIPGVSWNLSAEKDLAFGGSWSHW